MRSKYKSQGTSSHPHDRESSSPFKYASRPPARRCMQLPMQPLGIRIGVASTFIAAFSVIVAPKDTRVPCRYYWEHLVAIVPVDYLGRPAIVIIPAVGPVDVLPVLQPLSVAAAADCSPIGRATTSPTLRPTALLAAFPSFSAGPLPIAREPRR